MALEIIIGMLGFIFLLIYWTTILDPEEHKLPRAAVILLVPWLLTILIGLMQRYEECQTTCKAAEILQGVFYASSTVSVGITMYAMLYLLFSALKSVQKSKASYGRGGA